MKSGEIIKLMEEINPEALKMDNLDDAVVGFASRFGMSPVLLYDWQKCIDILIANGCTDREEADEYLSFNCLGAWMGDGTPAFTNIHGEENVE